METDYDRYISYDYDPEVTYIMIKSVPDDFGDYRKIVTWRRELDPQQ